MLFSCLIASPTNLAVVANQTSNDASIVDLTSLSTINTVACGNFAQYVAISPDGNFALVTNGSTTGANGVTVINLTTFATTPVDLGLGGSSPSGIVTTPTNKALICNAVTTRVSVIDIPTLAVSSIPVPGFCSPFKNSIVLATGIPSVTDMALVALNADMVAIDLATLTPTFISLSSAGATRIAVSKNQKKAFVVLPGSNAVVPIDLTTNPPSAGALISITNPTNIFIADNFNLALVITNDNTVVPIDLLSLAPLTPISVGTTPIYIGISGNIAFVANFGGNSITPIDLNLLTPSTNIAVGPAPFFVEPSLGLNPIMLVGNTGGNTLSTIDPVTLIRGSDISLAPSLGPHDIGFALLSTISSPSNISGKQSTINALFQKDIVNTISWEAPLSGVPAFYKLYRDSGLSDLITILNGNETIFYDHNRKKGLSYTYFIVAVDSSGNVSSAASITLP